MPDMATAAVVFLFGCVIGSFLNVCIVRIPRGTSIVFPGSHCPSCGNDIPFYHNIPLLSYILLGGRCRFCSSPIAFQYFAVELLTPALLVLVLWEKGMGPAFFAAAVFTAALIVITFIDLEHQIIPDRISLPGIPLGLGCSFFVPWTNPVDSLIGIAVGGGVLYGFAAGYRALTKKDGMGGGDIKLLAMIGAFLGWQGALAALILASFAGSIVGIAIIVFKGKDFKYAVPFGPFLSLGAVCALLYGDRLIRLYLSIGAR